MTDTAEQTPSGLRRYVSILDGIRPYQRAWLRNDIVAGITLAALAIPTTMGYTQIAGMPVITGLYTILFPLAIVAGKVPSRPRSFVAWHDNLRLQSHDLIDGLAPVFPRFVALHAEINVIEDDVAGDHSLQ